MTSEAVAPTHHLDAFNCPQADCGAYAEMRWGSVRAQFFTGGVMDLNDVEIAVCSRCQQRSVWVHGDMVFPRTNRVGPKPNPDLPDNVRDIYVEASEVGSISKKSAAGLLRLALQTLVNDLEPGADDLNKKIGALVKKGLSEQVQQAMDAVRVIGNESVHPGTIDLDEDDDVLPALFGLVNIVADEMISKPKGVSAIYNLIPANKLAGIQQRDQQS